MSRDLRNADFIRKEDYYGQPNFMTDKSHKRLGIQDDKKKVAFAPKKQNLSIVLDSRTQETISAKKG